MRAVLGPVGAIGDDGIVAEDRLHVGGKLGEPRHRRIDAGRRAHARQRRATPSRSGTHRRRPRRPRGWRSAAPAGDSSSRSGSPIPKNASTLRRRGRGAVGRAGLARRRIAGDVAAPGIGRLRRRAGLRIGQIVVRRNVHHHERIERDLEPPRLQLGDQMRDARVRRRAAERRAGHRPSRPDARSRASVRPPTTSSGCVLLPSTSTPGLIAQAPARRSSPNQATTIATRSRFGQRACRSSSEATTSAGACATWRFSALERAEAVDLHDLVRLVAELGRARDQRHRARHAFERADRTDDLERQLRNAVAEIGERQPLEHHIGEPAIGRRARPPWRRSAHRAPASRCRDRRDD